MKKGFTLIELLAVIVVLAIILAVAMPSISEIIKNSTKSSFASDAKMLLKAVEYKKLENESFDPLTITKANLQEKIGLNGNNYAQVTFTIVDNKTKIVLVGTGKWSGLTAHGTFKNMNVVDSVNFDETPPVITVLGDNPKTITAGTTYTDSGATALDLKDGDLTTSIVKTGSVNTAAVGTYTITYTVKDLANNTATNTRTVNVVFTANAPALVTGMTPIKWDGSTWITTTVSDTDWYSYTTTDKKWANAQTADGSMWVWIPRYAYKISSGWHSSTPGTIDIQFSIGIDDTRGGEITLDTGTTASASNNKWTNHPAFTFGTTQLTGIWAAKFEASGTTSAVESKPNVIALQILTASNMFTATRNMETNSRYGWGTTGTNIDTHLMKNSEWGALAYLSKSVYGKNTDEIWTNPADNYTTGCAGDSVSSAATTGCLRVYNTTNGVKASTTGNIYGIYDMSGGVWERVSAYVNNGDTNLVTYGSNIINADAKYKDVYVVGTSDTESLNYAANTIKGDAVYETSNTGQNLTSWFGDLSSMPFSTGPWFERGGNYAYTTSGGAFHFCGFGVGGGDGFGFRPVVLIGAGL